MIFLDSNVVVALIEEPDADNSWAYRVFSALVADNNFVCNLIVVAEVAAGLSEPGGLPATLDTMAIETRDLDRGVALRAAAAFREYRLRGGARSTILPDFLIAAHAATLGARLMTRDRRLGSYFPDLTLITPETHP